MAVEERKASTYLYNKKGHNIKELKRNKKTMALMWGSGTFFSLLARLAAPHITNN